MALSGILRGLGNVASGVARGAAIVTLGFAESAAMASVRRHGISPTFGTAWNMARQGLIANTLDRRASIGGRLLRAGALVGMGFTESVGMAAMRSHGISPVFGMLAARARRALLSPQQPSDPVGSRYRDSVFGGAGGAGGVRITPPPPPMLPGGSDFGAGVPLLPPPRRTPPSAPLFTLTGNTIHMGFDCEDES